MKCKIFRLNPQNEFDEVKLNKFLASVEVKQVFAEVVGGDEHFWSILAFYEDVDAFPKIEKTKSPAKPERLFAVPAPETAQPEIAAPEPVVLNSEQEAVFNLLKKWRNEKAAQDGIPPYMIAHNDSLLQIAAAPISTKEDLIQIKGFGDKRAQKHGDEILRILGVPTDSESST